MTSTAPDEGIRPFRDIHAEALDKAYLQRELASRGYVLIRKLLPLDDINGLLHRILPLLSEAGWLLPGHALGERIANKSAACGESDPRFEAVYEKIFSLDAFHALPHHPKLREVMQAIVGPRLLVHPKPIGRLIFPDCERLVIPAHQDHYAIGGEATGFTAWMPLHDCPVELGPLQVFEESHRFGVQQTDPATGLIVRDTAKGNGWVGGQINAGDVLIFHCLCVHAASPNTSNQLRISLDCRFQDYKYAINPANLVFPGLSGRSWETTYANWTSEDLKYFWKQIPLTFKPTLPELALLAQTAEHAKMRARYARILDQIQLQIPEAASDSEWETMASPQQGQGEKV